MDCFSVARLFWVPRERAEGAGEANERGGGDRASDRASPFKPAWPLDLGDLSLWRVIYVSIRVKRRWSPLTIAVFLRAIEASFYVRKTIKGAF